jgi:hypothetical protein
VTHNTIDEDPHGVRNPNLLALGLGGTNMMSMLWAVAMGRRAVGVEMRGDPFLGVQWNIRVELFHQLGLIDKLMLERYGERRIPRRGNSQKLFLLAETLYSPHTQAGDIVADEIIDGFDLEQHVAGTIHHVEFIDDRWRDGVPNRTVTLLPPPPSPTAPDPSLIRTNMRDVLEGPSTFQAGAASVLILLRRYLEKMEKMDIEGGYQPRVRLFTRHRVVNTPDGFMNLDDGRIGFRIEALQEFDYKGQFVRVRRPGSKIIEIGVPELFLIAQGFHSSDAERLGFKQEDVVVDHNDGRGPVVAQADFLAGLLGALVGGRLRRRISSEFDEHGVEFWVRQIAVGHEEDPEVAWCLVQVPDFKRFDPIRAGLVPEDTDPRSAEFFAAYETMLYDFFAQHVGDILELPREDVKKIQMVYGPKLFTLIERMGSDALIAPNGVVAGDSFGNGHFLTSGGAMTGMIGHSWRVYEYYQALDAGVAPRQAARTLADSIKDDTQAWLQVSAKEYSEAVPINFGTERIAEIQARSGFPTTARSAAIDATRRERHALLPLDPSDWRRRFLRNGRVYSTALPELHAVHPALRTSEPRRRGTGVGVVFVASDLQPPTLRFMAGVLCQPGVKMGLVTSASIGQLPDGLRKRLASVEPVADARDPDQIVDAIRRMRDALGHPQRLLGSADELVVPLAQVRGRMEIEGMRGNVARAFREADRMRDKLAAAGLPIARYVRAESVQDALAFGTHIGYYPLVVKPNEGANATNTYRCDTEEELRTLLERVAPTEHRPLICEEFIKGREYTFEVISMAGVPAWFSATRFDTELLDLISSRARTLTMTLPRELDDPADPILRRMGFAALKALGMHTGMTSIRWYRRPDGSPVIANVSASPPVGNNVSLMALAHGAEMYRVWGNVVVNGVFAPIPRLYAAGVCYFGGASGGPGGIPMQGLNVILRELGDIVVQVEPPSVERKSSDAPGIDGFVLVRHADTRVVDAALRRIAECVRVESTDEAEPLHAVV